MTKSKTIKLTRTELKRLVTDAYFKGKHDASSKLRLLDGAQKPLVSDITERNFYEWREKVI